MHARHAAPVLLLLLLTASAGSDDAMHVRAIQHGGWWELRYPDGTTAANELHVPVGRSVTIDVALDGAGALRFDRHFLPRLGSRATVTLNAPRADITTAHAYRLRQPHTSQLQIIGDEQFDAWIARQRSPAPPPHNPDVVRGEAVFLSARCTVCHTVRGVAIAEQPVGPDLTHVASRRTLAGIAPNRDGYLAGWIVDAETLKPGAGMPINNIDASDLNALLAFMRSLR